MTHCVCTKTPFILTFDGFMLAMDRDENAVCVEDGLRANEHIMLELAEHSKLHRETPAPLCFGDVVYITSKRKKRYLSGQSIRSQLIWTTKRSPKAMFRIVSRQHLQGPIELQDQFSLVSVQWPHYVVGCSKSSNKLTLRRHILHAIEFRVVDACHREYALSLLNRQRHQPIPVVYVSRDAFTIDLAPAPDTVTAFAVVHC